MNMKKTLMILWAVCYSLFAVAQQSAGSVQQGIVFHDNTPWADIVKMAEEQDKLIFIDCYTTWCGPCKVLAREVFPQKKVGDFFNPNFICVKYDMEKGDGKMLNERYKDHIPGYPTLLIIDKQGKVKQQMAGFQEADALIQNAQMALQGRDLFTLRKEYEAGNRDARFLVDFMASLEGAFLKDEAKRVADDYLNAHEPSELDRDEVWQAFGKYVTDIHSPAFDYLVNNAGRYGGVLKRDRQAINFQVKSACDKELRHLLRINFDKEGHAQPLSTDTAWIDKVIWYLEKTNQPGVDQYKLYNYIHKQLLKGQNGEAWEAVKMGVKARTSGFYSMKVGDYVAYMAPQTRDKKVLKDYLAVMEGYLNRGNSTEYTVYKTLADLNRRLATSSWPSSSRPPTKSSWPRKESNLRKFLTKRNKLYETKHDDAAGDGHEPHGHSPTANLQHSGHGDGPRRHESHAHGRRQNAD